MALAIILSVLAFAIALVALWLTSDIVKKVEGQNEKFVRAHISALREEIRELDKTLSKTTRLAKNQAEVQVVTDKRIAEHNKAIEGVRERITSLSEQLDDLDRSIPSRYRVRVVKADSKTDKPSIQ